MSSFDIDSTDRLQSHATVLADKPELREIFEDLHSRFLVLEEQHNQATFGLRIELGSGVYPLQRTDKGVFSAEVVPGAKVDILFDALRMPFLDASVQSLFLQNVFHHFPNPEVFFGEAERVLKPGGLVLILDPFGSLLGRLLYPRLFDSEHFDPKMIGWNVPDTGPMSGANQALSQIVFDRDRRIFEMQFPNLRIVDESVDPGWFRYLASGGLNFRRIAPRWAFRLARRHESRLGILSGAFGLHHFIVLRKSLTGSSQ